MSPKEIFEKLIYYFPFLLLLVIVIGFFISEWMCAYPNPQFQSILQFGLDQQVKLI